MIVKSLLTSIVRNKSLKIFARLQSFVKRIENCRKARLDKVANRPGRLIKSTEISHSLQKLLQDMNAAKNKRRNKLRLKSSLVAAREKRRSRLPRHNLKSSSVSALILSQRRFYLQRMKRSSILGHMQLEAPCVKPKLSL